jgi:hypothetical protein
LAAVVTGGKPTASESIVLEFTFTEIECRSALPGLNPLFSKKRVYRNLELRPSEHDYQINKQIKMRATASVLIASK